MDNFDLKKYLVENKVTTNSRMINENEEDFSVELLVPKIYFNVETSELAETPAAFGARSELKYMDITNYSDGEELIEWVFDGSLEKAKYFEKEYPGLFKIVGGSETMNEAEDSLIPNIKETAAMLKQESIPFKMVSEKQMEEESGLDMGNAGDKLAVIKLKDKKGNNIYISEFGYGSIGVDGAEIFDNHPEFWENHSEDWATDSPKEMVDVLKKYFL